jgi:DNA-binding CsgD family transcriptional regulator
VLQWVAQGKRNDEIGMILGVSPATVKKHLLHSTIILLAVTSRLSFAQHSLSQRCVAIRLDVTHAEVYRYVWR